MERRPGEARRLVPELLLTLLVLAGLLHCAIRFSVDGKLPQPFIFDINDTFMDWFNTAYWAHNPGAFDVWRTVYPPLSFAFLRLFGLGQCYLASSVHARDCDTLGIITILGSYSLCVVLAAAAFWRADPRTALFRAVSFGLGFPLLFTLERGNTILVGFIFFVLAYGNLTSSRLVRAISVGMTINFKPYLLLPALALLVRRRWRLLELAGIATLAVYFLSFAIYGAGDPLTISANVRDWVVNTGAFAWEQIYYSTSFAPFMQFNTPRFPTHEFIAERTIAPLFVVIPLVIAASQALLVLCLLGAWLQPRALTTQRLAFLLLATSLIGQSPGGYATTFLVFLLFMERWERPGPIIALVLGYLSCVPYDIVIANIVTLTGNSWLSGRTISAPFGLSIGMFVRPALIVGMHWALALDSLSLIVRAHREHRPTLGFGTPDARPLPA